MRLLATLIACIILSACAAPSNGGNDLELSLLRYEKAWRWNNAQVIGYYHKDAASQVPALAQVEKIRIGKYQVIDRQTVDSRHLKLRVRFTYYLANDIRVKTKDVDQTWELDDKLKRWVVTSPIPILE